MVLSQDAPWLLMGRHGECAEISVLTRKLPNLPHVVEPVALVRYLESEGHALTTGELPGAGGAATTCVGFVQLHPSFSSVALKRKFILNDMFVVPAHRRSGVARALLEAAEVLARSAGTASLVLATEAGNSAARALYASSGWLPESRFVYYNRVL